MGKPANVMASVLVVLGGGPKLLPAAEATVSRDLPVAEQTATVVTHIGRVADDASSAADVAKKAEATEDQLTSESDTHPSPDADPEGDNPQKDLLDLAGAKEEEEKRKVDAEGDAALKYREEQAQAAAEADQQRAEAAARADEESHQQAAAEDEERFAGPAEDTKPKDTEPEDTEPVDTEPVDTEPVDTEPVDTEPADETWLEDDADVDDPDID